MRDEMQGPRSFGTSFPTLKASVVLALALCLPTHAAAQRSIPGYPDDVRGYDPREVAMLPRYCIYTQNFRDHVPGGNDQVEIDRFYAMWGQTFHALHHYCWGMMMTNRGSFLAQGMKLREFYWRDAINEFDYVLERASPDFILLPEILSKKGENLLRLGLAAQAIDTLTRAAEVKPDYWPPYAYLSDYYKEAGDLKKAREWLERGLSLSPNAKGLTRRLAELDEKETKRETAPRRPVPKGQTSAGR
jgi:hypothetical protein